eukprot:Skav233450  [mRNA]  locus=scaffold1486:415971:422995:+ [translate_table: standard]
MLFLCQPQSFFFHRDEILLLLELGFSGFKDRPLLRPFPLQGRLFSDHTIDNLKQVGFFLHQPFRLNLYSLLVLICHMVSLPILLRIHDVRELLQRLEIWLSTIFQRREVLVKVRVQ